MMMPERNMKTEKRRTVCALVLNLAVAVLSAVGTAIGFQKYGTEMFAFYTVDSNLFAMLSCLVYAACLVRKLTAGKEIPAPAAMAKYTAVCCLSVTFLIVVLVLAPMNGPEGFRMMLLSDDMLYHHLFCPILSALSFFLFDRVPFRAGRSARYAMLPTVLYAAVIIVLNLLKVIAGPYPFLMVYQQPVCMSVLWLILILGGSYLIAWLIARLNRRRIRK